MTNKKSSNQPRVSVLTPIYNTNSEHLHQCIEGILNQTYTDFEFLILNDSPDNKEIEKIVKDYAKKDKRVKYYKNEKNLGISDSRNKLLDMAKGEYIAVCDHDDISLPDRFEQQVEYLDKHPYIGVVSGWMEYFENNKRTNRYWKTLKLDMDIKQALTQDCAVIHPAAMIKRSVLIDNCIRYESKYSPCEDYRLWTQLIEKTCFYNIQKLLLLYRYHDNRTSIVQKEKMSVMSRVISYQTRDKFPSYYKDFYKSKFRIKLFGFIPFLKINNNKVYLFEFIPLLKIKIRWQ